jgi:hypothetical protein
MEDIISFFVSPNFSGPLLIGKICFLAAGIILLVGIIFVLLKTEWLKRLFIQDLIEFSTYKMLGARKLVKTWEKITDRLKTANEAEYKLAIIEADNLLENVLKRLGYSGETFGDKLKAIGATLLPNLNEVIQAHQVRDKIVYDPDYLLTLDEAKETLKIYEEALRNLDAI